MSDKGITKLSSFGHRRGLPRRRFAVSAILILSILYLTFPTQILLPSWWHIYMRVHEYHSVALNRSVGTQTNPNFVSSKTKVNLEAHVMSKCPDARDCLRDLIVPSMEVISDLVDFQLSFIGSVNDIDDSVHCKHGPGECLGNILALCAQHLYPGNPKVSLGFSNCLISSYKEIPARSLVESCALEHAVDFGRLNDCASDYGQGEELLRASVLRSLEEGVVYSCTVRVDGAKWCIRDGGHWKECENGSSVSALIAEVKKRSSVS